MPRQLSKLFSRTNRRGQRNIDCHPPGRRCHRLAVELLEDRTVPSTFQMHIHTASGFDLTVTDGDSNDSEPTAGVITFIGAVGNFSITANIGESKPIIGSAASPDLELSFSATKAAGSPADTLTVEITDLGFTSSPLTMTSQIGGIFTGAFGQVASQAFFDNGNLPFGTGGGSSPLRTFTTNAFNATDSMGVTGAAPYSLTERLVVSAAAGGGTTSGSFETFGIASPLGSLSGQKFLLEPTPGMTGRMTGGGSVFTSATDSGVGIVGAGVRVTHGFELHCDPANVPNNLEINWAGGNNFHLTSLTDATCLDDPTISPNPPDAGFDTLIGTGVGKFNNIDGYTIKFTLTDAGEPGTSDTAKYLIWLDGNHNGVVDNGEVPVLKVDTKVLTFGNHQAHKEKASTASGGTVAVPWTTANGVQPITLHLYNTTTHADQHTTTDPNTGAYSFSNLTPGEYYVFEEFPAAFTEVTPTSGPSSAGHTVLVAGDVMGPIGYDVIVTAGGTVQNLDFQNQPVLHPEGRMTGGGSVFTSATDSGTGITGAGIRVTHGFTIDCDLAHPERLEINWAGGNNFHLDTLTACACFNDPTIDPGHPDAPIDTFPGVGTGKFNNVPGYTINFTFTDAGEPGTSDTAKYLIWLDGNNDGLVDNGEVPVLSVDTKFLTYGNHQAHVDQHLTAGAADAGAAVLLESGYDLRWGVVTVAVDGVQGVDAAAAEARVQDAINALNGDLTSAGVSLVEVGGADAANAMIHLRVAPTTVDGGVAEGLLGLTLNQKDVTIVSGWNWYLGTGTPGPNQYDFQTVITHELAHTLGLGHSTDTGSVMYPYLGTDQVRHDLTPSDLAVIDHDVEAMGEPLLAAPVEVGPPAGRVHVASAAPAAAAGPPGLSGAAPSLAVGVGALSVPLITDGRGWLTASRFGNDALWDAQPVGRASDAFGVDSGLLVLASGRPLAVDSGLSNSHLADGSGVVGGGSPSDVAPDDYGFDVPAGPVETGEAD